MNFPAINRQDEFSREYLSGRVSSCNAITIELLDEKGKKEMVNREERCARRKTYQFEPGGNTPPCSRLAVMKCSLHPVFYVLLGFSLPRFAAFARAFGSSGYEYLYPTVAV